LPPGNTSILPENIVGQSLSVGFRPLPQTTPATPERRGEPLFHIHKIHVIGKKAKRAAPNGRQQSYCKGNGEFTGSPESRPEQVEAPARKGKTGRQCFTHSAHFSRTFSAHLNGHAPSTHGKY